MGEYHEIAPPAKMTVASLGGSSVKQWISWASNDTSNND